MPNTNYGKASVTVPLETDYNPGGPDVPRAFEEYHDSLETDYLTAAGGRLLIAQPSDIARFKAMSGDGTIDKDGVLSIPGLQTGGVGGKFIETNELTRTNTAYGSLSTPLRVTLPKVLKGQLVEVIFAGFAKASIESESLGVGAAFQLKVGAAETEGVPLAEPGKVAANNYLHLSSVNSGKGLKPNVIGAQGFAARSPYTGYFGAGLAILNPERLLLGVVGEDTTNFIVEVLTKSSSGTVTMKNVMLLARAWG